MDVEVQLFTQVPMPRWMDLRPHLHQDHLSKVYCHLTGGKVREPSIGRWSNLKIRALMPITQAYVFTALMVVLVLSDQLAWTQLLAAFIAGNSLSGST